jgi:hypothetical protein
VPLWADEPAYALANRLARRNGVNSLASFGGDHAIPYREIIRGLRNAEIADLSGAEEHDLDKSTFRVEGERVHLNGEMLHVDDWSYSSLRVCPSCIRRDLSCNDGRKDYLPHVRSWWNLPAVTVCPIHRQALLDRHPACPEVPINHLSLNIRFIAEGIGDFANASSEAVADVRAEAYLLGRLGFMPRIFNPILDPLPLYNAIRLMDRFGAVAAAGVRGFTAFGGDVDVRKALAAGYAVFADGNAGLFRFLDQLVTAADIPMGKWGPRVVYGRIYEWLSHDTRDTAYDHVRKLVREHALNHIPLAGDDLLFGLPVGERRIYTLWHASRSIGVGPSATRRILKALGHLDESADGRPNWEITLRKSVVEKVAAELNDRTSFNEARDYLGLPRMPMASLCDSGILVPFLHVSTGVKEHVFRRRDLDAFVEALMRDAPVVKDPGNFYDVISAGKRAESSTAEVVSSLIDGRLRCAAKLAGAIGMMQILVDLDHVKALRNAGANVDESRTMEAGRRKLGLTWLVFGRLVQLGYIDATSVGIGIRNRSRNLIDLRSLEAFSSTYVSAAAIAAERRTHVRTLVRQLRQQGIEPAINNKEVGQYFYRRSTFAPLQQP